MQQLLALYGDERADTMGAINLRRAMRKMSKVGKTAVKFTPHYWAYRAGRAGIKKAAKMLGDERLSSTEYEELLGATKKAAKKKKKFLPGLKKVGKFTSGFTTAAARAVGVPAPLLKAFSKLDPTKKKKAGATQAMQALIPSEKDVVTVAQEAMKMDMKKVAIIAGSGVGALVLLKVLLSSSPKRIK